MDEDGLKLDAFIGTHKRVRVSIIMISSQRPLSKEGERDKEEGIEHSGHTYNGQLAIQQSNRAES